MKKRFFVLHAETNYGCARLEYYNSDKKWRDGGKPRRCIDLKTCLHISRQLHSKPKNIIAFYTQSDCFSVVADSAQELEDWLKDILEVRKNSIDGDDNSRNRLVFEHLWQVEIKKHDLDYKFPGGSYRVALTPKSLFLIRVNPLEENDYLEFPLMSIRRCGHSKTHFFIELGRSAITGAGEIYMLTDTTAVAQNMHETVLSAMKSSKIREDPLPRPRSASSSENSNPTTATTTSRPVGVVAPQTFSSSRERCDSLPTRPQTIVGEPYNFGTFSYPYTSFGSLTRDARPHSMYEWPSVDSPSVPNSMYSPGFLSGGNSSTENVNHVMHQPQNLNPYSSMPCGNPCSGELPRRKENYMRMSPNISEKSSPCDSMSMKKSNTSLTTPTDYVDMKPSSLKSGGGESTKKKVENYIPMAHGGAADEEPVVMQAGYMDMSPSNSFSSNSGIEKLKNFHHNSKNDEELSKSYELEKVVSLLQVEDASKNSDSFINKPSVVINDICSSNKSIPIPPLLTSNNSGAEGKPLMSEKTTPCKHTEAPLLNHKDPSPVKCLNPIVQKKKAKLGELDVFYSDSVLLRNVSSASMHYATNALAKSKAGVKAEEQIADVNKNPSSDNICDKSKETLWVESATYSGDYVNINLEKNALAGKHRINPVTFYHPSDPNYSNIRLGKPICPLPNPNLATSDNTFSTVPDVNFPRFEEPRTQNVLKPPLYSAGPETAKGVILAPAFRNIPNTLPAFRKQMSAPAGPLSLRPELPSPGRKSSCPVTASSSLGKPPMSPAYVTPLRPVHAHLQVTSSRSPDQSSVSSVSSASDEVSSAHSSPKIVSQSFGAINEQAPAESQYENVVIQQRPPSVSSEKELNYASLDLAPPSKEVPSPTVVVKPEADEPPLTEYAEIDFTKSEGLKNAWGSLREGRL